MIRSLSALSLTCLLIACATRSGVETQHLPDGTLRIKCDGALPACLAHAEDICRGKAYDVIRARDQRDRYGPEFGTAQLEVRSSEAIVRCGAQEKPLIGEGEFKLPPRPPESVPARTANPSPPAPAVRACVPGTTQACIGPGKCEGGQSCLPDGSAFGPCDCGNLGPPIVAPSGSASGGTATPPPPAPTVPGPPGAPPPTPPAPTFKPQTPPAQPLKGAAPLAPKH